MPRFFKILKVITCLLAIVILVIIVCDMIFNKSTSTTEYPNLEQFSIDAVNENQIVEIASYARSKGRFQRKGANTGMGGKYDSYDATESLYISESITGILTVSATKIIEGNLTLDIVSTLNSGEMTIVIVKNDNILEFINTNENVIKTYSVTEESEFYVKILCETANMEIKVTRSFD